jgi:hypothetical protein
MKSKSLRSLMFFGLIALFLAPAMQSCKSSKKTAAAPKGEERIVKYCHDPEKHFSDNDFFRSRSTGTSINQQMAKRKALSDARLELASEVGVVVKSVEDRWVSSIDVNDVEEYRGKLEAMSRQVVNEKLNGVRTICEEFTRTADGNYNCYVSLELGKDEIMNEMAKRISDDEKLRIDFQYEQFKNTFEEEMEKHKDKY